jgi:hypothetical protein
MRRGDRLPLTQQVYQRSYSQVGHIPPKMSDKFESQHSLKTFRVCI